MIAAGQNLKRLLKKRGWGRRPFPAEAMATVPPPSGEDVKLLWLSSPPPLHLPHYLLQCFVPG
jgi:hypothetical protein